MDAGQQEAGQGSRGRPRDPQIDRVVLESTLTLLDEAGYGHVAIEEVARRSHTTKPAIYRRWRTRQDLVLAALATRLRHARTPDTGCTMCDLNEGITVFIAAFRRIRPDVLGPLLADCAPGTRLHEAFMATLFDPPRTAVAEMLDRAVARGDIRGDVDRNLVLDMLGSLVHYRALFGHAPTSPNEVEHAVNALLRGIATNYPALLAHSRAMAAGPPAHAAHSG